jgi:hypothetical protein
MFTNLFIFKNGSNKPEVFVTGILFQASLMSKVGAYLSETHLGKLRLFLQTLNQAGKTGHGQTLELTRPVLQLRRFFSQHKIQNCNLFNLSRYYTKKNQVKQYRIRLRRRQRRPGTILLNFYRHH